MKYCSKCGKELLDEAVICPQCGCATGYPASAQAQPQTQNNSGNSGLKIAAKVLMIFGTVVNGLYIIPLAWCLPMTISYCNKIKRGQKVGIGFKVCCLLFVNTIAGILMLCDPN